MGCWNKTCLLTNLPITAGMPVYVIVIEKNDNYKDRCYTTSYWRPILFPIVAEYNDYGAGENCTGIAVDLILEAINYKKSDDAPPLENIEQFFDQVHDHKLFVKPAGSFSNSKTLVDFAMIRKDAIDYLFDKHIVSQGFTKSKKYKYQDVIDMIPDYIDRMKHKVGIPETVDDNYLGYLSLEYEIVPWVEANPVEMLYSVARSYRYSRTVNVTRLFQKNILVDTEKCKSIMECIVLGAYIDHFMDSVRKVWIPGGHDGSQACEFGPYKLLMNCMKVGIKNEQAKYEG